MQDAESPTIRKDLALPIGLDYARLRAEGVQLLQQLSGDIWTDYNEHDPGVTILEALCYALTDLTNRASQPMADLLAAPPGTPARPGSTLVPAHKVLANHPVTAEDYKKIVLDDLELREQVRSAWVRPHQSGLAGEYAVYVGLHQHRHQHFTTVTTPADQPALTGRLRRTLNRYRGLGEEFVEVVYLQPYAVSVGGHLEIREGYLHEVVLAEVLWQLNHFFEPGLASRGLKYLEAHHVPAEKIFEGPQLRNQLLQASEFGEPRLQVAPAMLAPLLADLEGIGSLSGLSVYEPHHLQPTATICIRPDQELVLDAEATLLRLNVSQRGVALKFDPQRVLHKFEQLHSDRSRSLSSPLPKSKLRFAEPAGRYLDLGHYDSIQHSFPTVYGVGEGGPPVNATPDQRAQALQLKGYLLFFEQIMANFCAQLEHTEDLLSARHQAQGHFSQPLTDVPGLDQLLYDTEPAEIDEGEGAGEADSDSDTAAAAAVDEQGRPLSRHYLRKLGRLAEDPSEFLERRDTLLGHMLARFGYVVTTYHPTLTDPDQVRRSSIRARERLLQNLNTATYHRGAARVGPDDATPNVAGLELFIYLLTGIRYFQLTATLGEQLRHLAAEVQFDDQPQPPGARLRVRGGPADFSAFLRLQYQQLTAPTLQAHPAAAARVVVLVPGATPGRPAAELELHASATAPEHALSPEQQVQAYLAGLDERLNRFILLDHRTLKPARFDPAAPPAPGAPDRSFYEFQLSICLPDFTRQFLQRASSNTGADTYTYREYVQNLILTYAPAHLLINVLWLDYPSMRELEDLYEPFVAASGLLANSDGLDGPDLPGLQQQLAAFLLRQPTR